MTGCPIAYTDPCGECAQYGSCAPSQAAQKIETLESHLLELKQIVGMLLGKNQETGFAAK